jgi:predicted transposase YbfD/YdcC
MKCIKLQAKGIEGLVLDLSDLCDYLNQLSDPRDNRGKIYQLGTLLTLIVLARLSGEDKPYGIFDWLRHQREELVEIFGLERGQTPCLNTIRTILSEVLRLEELEKVLQQYLNSRYGGQNSQLISIDGKIMRGTIPTGQTHGGVHLLSAYLAEDGIVLKQVVVPEEGETKATSKLLAGLHLKNKVVCADALHTKRPFCVNILARGGDYLLIAKLNQLTLLEDIERFFVPPRYASGWHITSLPYTTASSCVKAHGRLEKRTLTLMTDEEKFVDWPGLQQVFKLERYTKNLATGKETSETVFGLTSCTPVQAGAAQLLTWVQQYWRIENSLHYRRDVTLHEDKTYTTHPQLAQAISIINNFLVGLVQKLGYDNLAAARRFFNVSIARQIHG